MEDDLKLGLYIIVVLCLIVIAMSLHKMSFSSMDYFSVPGPSVMLGDADVYGNASNSRILNDGGRSDRFVGSGANEFPVFNNLGDVESTQMALQAAIKQKESFESKRVDELVGY